MGNFFEIDWQDLSYEKQQDILDTLKVQFNEELKQEAEENRKKYPNREIYFDDYTKKPGETLPVYTTYEKVDWRIIIVDLYSLSFNPHDWSDERRQGQLEYTIEEFCDEKAHEKIANHFRQFTVEI